MNENKDDKNIDEEFGKIKIPKYLIRKIEECIKGTEFNSIEEYITFVLEEIVKNDEDESSNKDQEIFSEEDEKNIKNRLRALGYI